MLPLSDGFWMVTKIINTIEWLACGLLQSGVEHAGILCLDARASLSHLLWSVATSGSSPEQKRQVSITIQTR